MSQTDFSWAVPVMRAGYAGRALTYLAVAGLSLWALAQGGQAQGTSSIFEDLRGSWWGVVVLSLIAAGLIAYAVWRLVDAIWDLEDYGSDGEGALARAGMIATGAIHAALGVLAISLLSGDSGGAGGEDGGGGTSIASLTATVMGWPGGRWIVGIGAIATIGAGLYYLRKGWRSDYTEHLAANPVTRRLNDLLRAGVIAQGMVLGIVSGLFLKAAIRANPDQAGGLGGAFDWLTAQPFGRLLVGALCAGLLLFALFCAVNARYRIVTKAADPDMATLKSALA
ncbi:MAG: DUF1206 domain-containing protein [Paracoccaceae bacterium]